MVLYDEEEATQQVEQGVQLGVQMYRLQNFELLEQLEHQLRGEVFNGHHYVRKHPPWCNDDGISRIIGICSAVGLNKNIQLGNLTHEEIYTRCRLIWYKLANMLAVSYYKYGVSKDTRSMLIQLVIQQVHSSLSRSEMGREAKQLSSTTQHIEHFVREEKQRGGVIQGLFKKQRANEK